MHNAKQCHDCNTIVDIGDLGEVCKSCGGSAFKLITITDYWFDLAVNYGYERTATAAALIREFFDIWNVREYASFGDFMRAEVLTA